MEDDYENIKLQPFIDFIKKYWLSIFLMGALIVMFYYYQKDMTACHEFYNEMLKNAIILE